MTGPVGVAVVKIVYYFVSSAFDMIFGPILVIPKMLLFGVGGIADKILAIPPLLIMISGGLFKPILWVLEPFVRTAIFIFTGDFKASNELIFKNLN